MYRIHMRGPITLLQDAWGIFSSNPKLFLGIYLVPAIIMFAFALYAGVDEEAGFTSVNDIIIFTVFMIVIIIVNIMMGVAMMKAVADPAGTTIGSAYNYAKQYFLAYIWLAFLVGVVTMLGFIAFIIPGIIFSVWFAFSYFILLFEGKRGVEAMKASKAYVKGRWWAVFGRYAFLVLIAIVVSAIMGFVATVLESGLENIGGAIASFLFNAIVIPVAIGYSYLMYKDLSGTPVTIEPVPSSPNVAGSNEPRYGQSQ